LQISRTFPGFPAVSDTLLQM